MENRVAVFIDFENIKRAVDDHFVNERVDIKRILDEVQRVSEGRILVKRAYADWGVFKDYRSDLLDNATEPVQAFALNFKGKNGADIRIAIDVMDVVLRQQADITHVAVVSGDSDFTPLVMKLREFGKFVIGVGVHSNTSNYLAKSCDRFSYYDDLHGAQSDDLPAQRAAAASAATVARDPAALLAGALAALGGRVVTGSALKTQMKRLDPLFDETRHGYPSFLEFLRAHHALVDLHKPAVGDLSVAPKGALLAGGGNGTTVITAAAGGTPGDKVRLWLRDNNFRYVPWVERREIIHVVWDIFTRAAGSSEEISLKEAKDRLHSWFEENRPAVPWESINSTVYHLFYTWCFVFDKSDNENTPLWDRPTRLHNDVRSADELIARCEKGIVRKLWERDRSDVDAQAVGEWLYDGDEEKLLDARELIRSVAASAAGLALPANGAAALGPVL